MTSFPYKLHASKVTTVAVACASLLAMASALYLSQGGLGGVAEPQAKTRTVARPVWQTPSPNASTVTRYAYPPAVKSTTVDIVHPPVRVAIKVNKIIDLQRFLQQPVPKPLPHCWDFKWQQDAQLAYLANLSDPGGLDGPAGFHNGDGIACNQLPVDPSRARSQAVDAEVTPTVTVPTKAELLAPAKKYFGFSNDALPGDVAAFNGLDLDVGKAPSLVEWFDTWDHPYALNGRKVADSWDRGALPVLTWMPEAKGGNNKDQSAYTLTKIIAGNWDAYLATWAAQVVQTGLPLVLRFAHEMNGSWYPWSATSHGNTRQQFIAAWQHVWNVFQAAGANKYVIWAWTPVRDTPGSGYPSFGSIYPGDKYVDWVGMSGYSYGSKGPISYSSTFGYTFGKLKSLTKKPIFVAETSAAEAITTPSAKGKKTFATKVDYGNKKASWFTQTLDGFADDSQVVGFVMFNNYVPNVHTVPSGPTHKRVKTETDWRWNSSPVAAAAFRTAIADTRYSGGVMPEPGVVTSSMDPPGIPWPVVAKVVTPAPSPSTTETPPDDGSIDESSGTDLTGTAVTPIPTPTAAAASPTATPPNSPRPSPDPPVTSALPASASSSIKPSPSTSSGGG
ncbi:glycoside hydrolase family 26 protein [Jatrophihabitans sp. DSM 45814]